jgi:glycerol transport system ATP-binding protein
VKLRLEQVDKQVGASTHLFPMDLALQPNAVTVLLGATQAGKTTLMRLMAGLDRPSHGRVWVDGVDVTGVAVRQRNVSMVYQQFINYPSMTVAQNIASPLKLRGEKDIERRVRELASRLHIDPFLERLPAELSGGQQQRVALARALAKGAPLMLLDEPLVNLDYKLREELREELAQLFAAGDSTVVYATTEPGEALLMGGYTAVLDAGELLQYGPTTEVFHRPLSLRVARAFSDPPMNTIPARRSAAGLHCVGGPELPMTLPNAARIGTAGAIGTVGAVGAISAIGAAAAVAAVAAAGDAAATTAMLTLGVRASALRLLARPGDVALPGRVELAEISGSDTFVHVHTAVGELVAQFTGVHFFELGAPITLHLAPGHCHVFDSAGALLLAPAR